MNINNKTKISKNILNLSEFDEIVKPIPGWGGRYFISDKGRVFSNYRNKAKVLKPGRQKSGHLHVNLSLNGYSISTKIHKIVMGVFVGDCPDGFEIRHLNGNPADNRLDNLKYGTRKENTNDSIKHGVTPKGSRNGMSKLTEDQVILIRNLYANGDITHEELAKRFHIGRRHVGDIINKVCWGWLENE